MGHSSRSGARGRQGTSRSTSWSLGPNGVIQRTATGSVIFAVGAQALSDGNTVIRTRGELLIGLSAATSAVDGYSGAVGICIVTENAFNAGIASIPTPITDIVWDGWLAYQSFASKLYGPDLGRTATVARYQLDSKAMRKIKVTDVMVAVLEATEVGSSTLNMSLETRVLVKLP